jgi:hypothetical protein
MESLDDLAEDQLHSFQSGASGACEVSEDYPWTSFRAFYLESEEPLLLDHEWWWPEDSEKLAKASEILQGRFRKK